MDYLWHALSAVFFFSLMMLAASVFTPKTAWFFKEKSRLRGAILWMSTALVSSFVVIEFAPPMDVPALVNATARDQGIAGLSLPAHDVMPVTAVPGERLVLNGSLSGKTDEKTLLDLGRKAYEDHSGREYKDMFILWRLPEQGPKAKAWAETNSRKGEWEVIIREGAGDETGPEGGGPPAGGRNGRSPQAGS